MAIAGAQQLDRALALVPKRELLDMAAQTGLNPHVVEKDYALGWMLAGIYAHEQLAESWVFKGGTCLKKCYFETYRFSEDLDFTLKDPSHLDHPFLTAAFADVAEWVYDNSGIEIPAELQRFDLYENPRGQLSCEGSIKYRGPVSPPARPRIKLDLAADERLVMAPVRRQIFHPYSDEPETGIEVLTYAYEEAFGEKLRALGERTRPRDLYDVINLYRNEDSRPLASVLLNVLAQKCAYKGIEVPKLVDLEGHRPDLEAAWHSMLAHQLPALPPVASFWNVLPEFFAWLEDGYTPIVPASYSLGSGETVLRGRELRLPLRSAAQSHLEIIRFAAANRLCVELDYQRSTRVIEPYSLRQTQEGNIILHAWSVDRNAHRSYRVDRIQGARITDRVFQARYAVELNPSGPVSIAPTSRSSGVPQTIGTNRIRGTGRRSSTGSRVTRAPLGGPTYVYQCGICGKKFSRKKQTTKLSKHKAPSGLQCPGRVAMLVDTKY